MTLRTHGFHFLARGAETGDLVDIMRQTQCQCELIANTSVGCGTYYDALPPSSASPQQLVPKEDSTVMMVSRAFDVPVRSLYVRER